METKKKKCRFLYNKKEKKRRRKNPVRKHRTEESRIDHWSIIIVKKTFKTFKGGEKRKHILYVESKQQLSDLQKTQVELKV